MPWAPLPEMMLRAAAVAPPTWLLPVLSTIPVPVLPRPLAPAALVPTKLPAIVAEPLELLLDVTEMPDTLAGRTPLPAITLPAPAVVPPMVALGATTEIPVEPLAS